MPGHIPSHFIDDLLNRVDIVDVIDQRVALKKKGREYSACCPFHSEKTPSFTVSPEKQFYHCFGCGVHGSAIGFLMEFERLDFVDAIEELASQVGMAIPRESITTAPRIDKTLYDVLQQATDIFKRQLREAQDAARAVEYLKARGLSGEISAEFAIGYAPPGWDLLGTALRQQGISNQQLVDAGLVIAKQGGGHYDRFRDRIMFPIRNRRGRVIAFGGRVLGDDTPKYLNSPETALFHKGQELYGLYEARKSLRHLQQLVVVEGYMDVISLACAGIRYAVASLGTATTVAHLDRLFRASPTIIFCFDGDHAGREAAWRALTNALPLIIAGRQVSFMFLPDGEDPDTIVRKEGADGFTQRLNKATPLSRFFYDGLSAKTDLSTLDGRSLLIDEARPLLNKLPAGAFRHMMIDKLAAIAQINPQKLATLIHSTGEMSSVGTVRRKTHNVSPVRTAIRLILETPQLALSVDIRKFEDLQLSGIPLLCQLIEMVQSNPHITCGALLERWRDHQDGEHLTKLMRMPQTVPSEGFEAEFEGTINLLTQRTVEQRIDRLLEKQSRNGDLSNAEKQELKELLATKRA